MIKYRILFLSVFIYTLFSSCAQERIFPYFSCTPTLVEPYGITSHIGRKTADYEVMDEQLDLMNEIGINWVRADLDWRQNKNVIGHYAAYNEFMMDSVLIKTQRAGIKLLPILSTFDRDINYAWDDFENYQTYVNYILHRYGYGVSHIEVMNEVNLIKNSEGNYTVPQNAEHYNNVLPRISNIIRSSNTDTKVVIGGLGRLDDDFLERIVEKDAPSYIDIMNFHCYEMPEKFEKSFSKLKKSMETNNWNKHVWLTETGYSVDLDSVNSRKSRTAEDQAKYIARAYLVSFAYGIDKVFLYNLKDWKDTPYQRGANYGILYYNMKPRPGLQALKTLIKMCPDGSTRPDLVIDGSIYHSSWERPDGTKVHAIWTTDISKEISVKLKGKGKMYDYMGSYKRNIKSANRISVNSGVTYVLGPKTILIQ